MRVRLGPAMTVEEFMSAAIHVAWIETKNHVPASFILLRGDRIGRAADRGPDGRVGHGLVGL